MALAQTLSGFPQTAMRNDRRSAIEQWGFDGPAAIANEVTRGLEDRSPAAKRLAGSARFKGGAGRHGYPIGGVDKGSAR